MARVKFPRDKPHINTGSNSQSVEDTSGGRLFSVDAESTGDGNPAPSSTLDFSAPGGADSQLARVAFPIDSEFQYDPTTFGAVEFIDAELDILSSTLDGTDQVEVSLVVFQRDTFYLADRTPLPIIDSVRPDWQTIEIRGLEHDDFIATGGTAHPDFSQPFQFGYGFSAEYSTSALQVNLGLDNMLFELTTVPEPSFGWLGWCH